MPRKKRRLSSQKPSPEQKKSTRTLKVIIKNSPSEPKVACRKVVWYLDGELKATTIAPMDLNLARNSAGDSADTDPTLLLLQLRQDSSNATKKVDKKVDKRKRKRKRTNSEAEVEVAVEAEADEIKEQNSELLCVCRTLADSDDERFYIQCNTCDEWFHGDCVGITEEIAAEMEVWYCPYHASKAQRKKDKNQEDKNQEGTIDSEKKEKEKKQKETKKEKTENTENIENKEKVQTEISNTEPEVREKDSSRKRKKRKLEKEEEEEEQEQEQEQEQELHKSLQKISRMKKKEEEEEQQQEQEEEKEEEQEGKQQQQSSEQGLETYCICKTPASEDDERFFVCCERCEGWYHGECMKLSQEVADGLDAWYCMECASKDPTIKNQQRQRIRMLEREHEQKRQMEMKAEREREDDEDYVASDENDLGSDDEEEWQGSTTKAKSASTTSTKSTVPRLRALPQKQVLQRPNMPNIPNNNRPMMPMNHPMLMAQQMFGMMGPGMRRPTNPMFAYGNAMLMHAYGNMQQQYNTQLSATQLSAEGVRLPSIRWGVSDVLGWLANDLRLPHLLDLFRQAEIAGSELLVLEETDLLNTLEMTVDDTKKIMTVLKQLPPRVQVF